MLALVLNALSKVAATLHSLPVILTMRSISSNDLKVSYKRQFASSASVHASMTTTIGCSPSRTPPACATPLILRKDSSVSPDTPAPGIGPPAKVCVSSVTPVVSMASKALML